MTSPPDSAELNTEPEKLFYNQYQNIELPSAHSLQFWRRQPVPAQQVHSICVNYGEDRLHITAEFLQDVSDIFPNVESLSLVHPDFEEYSGPPDNSPGKLITLSIMWIQRSFSNSSISSPR